MTDEQIIETFQNWYAFGDPSEMPAEVAEGMLRLSRAGLAKQPPEGAVQVRVAVARGETGEVVAIPCGEYEDPGDALLEATAHFCTTHSAIVTAWLPRVQVAEVEGVCDAKECITTPMRDCCVCPEADGCDIREEGAAPFTREGETK